MGADSDHVTEHQTVSSDLTPNPGASGLGLSPELLLWRWRLPADQSLGRRTWDRAAIVHDPRSGETHYLNMMSIVALEQFEQREGGDLSLDELASKMAVYLDVERSSVFDQQVVALLERFDQLGLIEPCMKTGQDRP